MIYELKDEFRAMGAMKDLSILIDDMGGWSDAELLDAWYTGDKLESMTAHGVLTNRITDHRTAKKHQAAVVQRLMEHEDGVGEPL